MPVTPPRPRHVLARIVLALAMATTVLPAAAAIAPPAVQAASGPSFGLATHVFWQTLTQTRADLDRMKAAGMRYVRFDVSWRNMEPARGTYRYLTKLDAVISAIRSRGMRLTMTVIDSPAWANGGRDARTPPDNMGDYARFVGVLARRYAARSGMVYEIWNEPNDIHFWSTGPSAARYTAMLKAAYRAIKAADPDATVLGGSILANDLGFLRAIYANGGGPYFNGLSIHAYCGNRAPGDTSSAWFSFKRSVPQFKAVMAARGRVKPIWITEFGWSTAGVSDATRATYYRQAVAIAKGWTGVPAIGGYTLHQSQFPAFGLVRPDGSATATWRAYAAVLP